jgi:hypothetical protein
MSGAPVKKLPASSRVKEVMFYNGEQGKGNQIVNFLSACRLQVNRRLAHFEVRSKVRSLQLNRRPFATTELRLRPGSLAT